MKLFVLVASLLAACSAFAPATPALQLSKVAASRADASMMARAPPKKAAKAAKVAKAAPKKAAAPKKVVKKAAPKPAPKPVAKKAPVKRVVKKAPAKKVGGGKSPVGKGGIFPWITNEPGTYGKPFMLSAVDFTSDDGDAWIGWGFMPKSVKDTLYPKGYKGMLNK